MFQSFSTQASRDFKPLQLNNTAKVYDRRGINFLAFGGPTLKKETIEYQKADLSQYTAKSAEVPFKVTNLKDSPVLDNTFNKKGVFAFRYTDVANPVAYGDDYNMDFGGKDPTAIGYFGNKEREVADYIKKDMHFTDRYNNLKPRQWGEKMGGQKDVSLSDFNPLKAYSTYGYRESMDWKKDEDYVGAMAVNVRKKKEKSYIMDIDKDTCPSESIVVNGDCVPLNDSARYCPEGFHYIKGHGCQAAHNKPLSATMETMAKVEMQKAVCPMGWEFKDGMCQVANAKKELSTAEPEKDESACAYTLGILLSVGVVVALAAVFARSYKADNKPRV